MSKTPYFGFCPQCEKETNQVHLIDEPEQIVLGDVTVTINSNYYHCEECGEDYDIPSDGYDPLALAYDEYERITGKKWKGIYR